MPWLTSHHPHNHHQTGRSEGIDAITMTMAPTLALSRSLSQSPSRSLLVQTCVYILNNKQWILDQQEIGFGCVYLQVNPTPHQSQPFFHVSSLLRSHLCRCNAHTFMVDTRQWMHPLAVQWCHNGWQERYWRHSSVNHGETSPCHLVALSEGWMQTVDGVWSRCRHNCWWWWKGSGMLRGSLRRWQGDATWLNWGLMWGFTTWSATCCSTLVTDVAHT